ncbi:hypothetical protein [Bradyrhizobium sp. USDA 4350]
MQMHEVARVSSDDGATPVIIKVDHDGDVLLSQGPDLIFLSKQMVAMVAPLLAQLAREAI